MRVLKAVIRGIVGLLFGIGAMLALIPAFAAFHTEGQGAAAGLPWLIPLLGLLAGIFAPTLRRAFGRGFLLLGFAVLALPVSVMMLSGRVANDMLATTDNEVATGIGSGIAGAAMTGIAGIVGVVLGAILIIVGLILALGGRREVYIVRDGS